MWKSLIMISLFLSVDLSWFARLPSCNTRANSHRTVVLGSRGIRAGGRLGWAEKNFRSFDAGWWVLCFNIFVLTIYLNFIKFISTQCKMYKILLGLSISSVKIQNILVLFLALKILAILTINYYERIINYLETLLMVAPSECLANQITYWGSDPVTLKKLAPCGKYSKIYSFTCLRFPEMFSISSSSCP